MSYCESDVAFDIDTIDETNRWNLLEHPVAGEWDSTLGNRWQTDSAIAPLVAAVRMNRTDFARQRS